jgi:YHS domain-containing protein
MFKKIFMLLIAVIFIMGISGLVYAMSCCDKDSGHSQHQQIAQAQAEQTSGTAALPQAMSKESVNAGNKICPVTGDKIDEKTKSTVEYDSKIYNLCCSACINEFKSDPQKYIKKVEEEKQSSSKK